MPTSSLTRVTQGHSQYPGFRAGSIWLAFAAESDRASLTYVSQLSCSTVDACYSYQVKQLMSMAVLTRHLGDKQEALLSVDLCPDPSQRVFSSLVLCQPLGRRALEDGGRGMCIAAISAVWIS